MLGWLSNLAIFGTAAGIYAANSEKVPLTGRRQLLFRWCQPTATAHTVTGLPRGIIFEYPYIAGSVKHIFVPLQQQGLQLMQSLYQQAARGVDQLALSNPDLRRRLAALPSSVKLCHQLADLNQQAGHANGRGHWYVPGSLWNSIFHPAQFELIISAGLLLQQDSAKALLFMMSHEVGHGIAKHIDEKESWKMLITGTIFGRLALTGMGPKKVVAAAYLASRLACHLYVDTFLSHQHEHEADLLGTAISISAGCSCDDIVAGLARLQSHQLLADEDTLAKSVQPIQKRDLASLSQLLPDLQVPDAIEDSRALTAFTKSIDVNLGSFSDERRKAAQIFVDSLWLTVVQRLQLVRNPVVAMTGSHPHWSDRVAQVRRFSQTQHMKLCLGDIGVEAHHSLALQLEAYQASPAWPKVVKLITKVSGKTFADDFHHCMCIRRRTQQSLLLEAAKQLLYSYDFNCQTYCVVDAALAEGIQRVPNAAFQDWLKHKAVAALAVWRHACLSNV